MSDEKINNLRALLIGGDGAPGYAPDGLLTYRELSVEKLARLCRVTRTAMYNYISGTNRPTAPVLRRMCEALDIPYEVGLEFCTPAQVGRPPVKKG